MPSHALSRRCKACSRIIRKQEIAELVECSAARGAGPGISAAMSVVRGDRLFVKFTLRILLLRMCCAALPASDESLPVLRCGDRFVFRV